MHDTKNFINNWRNKITHKNLQATDTLLCCFLFFNFFFYYKSKPLILNKQAGQSQAKPWHILIRELYHCLSSQILTQISSTLIYNQTIYNDAENKHPQILLNPSTRFWVSLLCFCNDCYQIKGAGCGVYYSLASVLAFLHGSWRWNRFMTNQRWGN